MATMCVFVYDTSKGIIWAMIIKCEGGNWGAGGTIK